MMAEEDNSMDIETSGSNGNPLDIAPRDTAILNHKGETQSAGPSDPQLSKQGENPSELDSELEAMKKRLLEMEQESFPMNTDESADPLTAPGSIGTAQFSAASAARKAIAEVNASRDDIVGDDAIADADSRSIYVGNVDYSATVEELSKYFEECGTINRVTIMTHKPTRTPKGYAYVEFKDQHAVQNAIILNEAMFKGRQLKITPKRTNVPGLARGVGFGRARGRLFRGRSYLFGRRPRGRGRGRWVPY